MPICKLMMLSLDAIECRSASHLSPTSKKNHHPTLPAATPRPTPWYRCTDVLCGNMFHKRRNILRVFQTLRARWIISIDGITGNEYSTRREQVHTVTTTRRDWLDQLHGGLGCWTTRSE